MQCVKIASSLKCTLTDVKKVSKQAASNGLMTHNEDIFLSFQLHYHWFQSHHEVLV